LINLLLLAYAKYSSTSQRWISAGSQLFAAPTNPVTHFLQKIPFINLQKPFLWVSTMCTNIRV